MDRSYGETRSPHRWRNLFLVMLVLSLAFTAQPALAAAGQPEEAGAELTAETAKAFLDEWFSSESAQSLYTGAAVAVVKNGEIIAKEGYGYADKEAERAVDPDTTVFRLASVSKTFTAVAIMQLAEQGLVDLDGDIRSHLPAGLEFDNPFDKPVTVADLLLHRSGLAPSEPLPSDMVTDLSIDVGMEQYAGSRMPNVIREPGSAYMYDNFAYLLLGLIVEQASGQPFETYMEEHVFRPLGMTMSGFVLEGALLDHLVTNYDALGEPLETYMYLPNVMPHGGMLSTADDMARFMTVFLNGGQTTDGRLLDESSIQAMLEYRSAIHPLLPDTTYGFEAPMQVPGTAAGSGIVAKYGDLPGNSSMLMFIPDEEVGVFLTYNHAGPLRNLFFQAFMTTFFPEYLKPLATDGRAPADAGELARYEGLYADLRLSGLVSRVQVTEEDGQPVLAIHDAYLGTRPLLPADDRLFVDGLTGTLIAFHVNDEGEAVYMREGNLNPLGYARKADEPAGFSDISETDPYAPYIHVWQSLGLYPNEPGHAFEPEKPVTRAELARDLLIISGVPASGMQEPYAFTDLAGHEWAPYVQMAAEMGMVLGDGEGLFHPDRPATRQEAAVMVWNIYRLLYPAEMTSKTALAGEYAPWAEEAIRMAVTFGLHGPEVAFDADGAADFRGNAPLTRREAAAFYHQLVFQPVDQIIAQWMQETQEQPESVAEPGLPDDIDEDPAMPAGGADGEDEPSPDAEKAA